MNTIIHYALQLAAPSEAHTAATLCLCICCVAALPIILIVPHVIQYSWPAGLFVLGFVAFPMPEIFPKHYWLFHSLWHVLLAAGYYELYALIEFDSNTVYKKAQQHKRLRAKKQTGQPLKQGVIVSEVDKLGPSQVSSGHALMLHQLAEFKELLLWMCSSVNSLFTNNAS